jgi:predicted RNA-binding Zn ribbon-like protein
VRSPIPTDWGVAPSLDLINSRFNDHLGSGEVYDRLPLPEFRKAFLERWEYRVKAPQSAAGWERLAELRRLLREGLVAYAADGRVPARFLADFQGQMNVASPKLALERSEAGYRLALKRSGTDWDGVVSDVATSAARLIAEGRRVKVCANPNCSWMFVDESRPGSRRWCNVRVCGSLINVRQFRAVRSGRRR